MMGGPAGHHPGRVVEFDGALRVVAEHPAQPPDDGFNPHGISVRPELNLMVTSDFVCPSTTLHVVPGGLDLRGSVRVWDYRARKILRSVPIPNAGGTIDVQLIPGDRRGRLRLGHRRRDLRLLPRLEGLTPRPDRGAALRISCRLNPSGDSSTAVSRGWGVVDEFHF